MKTYLRDYSTMTVEEIAERLNPHKFAITTDEILRRGFIRQNRRHGTQSA